MKQRLSIRLGKNFWAGAEGRFAIAVVGVFAVLFVIIPLMSRL